MPDEETEDQAEMQEPGEENAPDEKPQATKKSRASKKKAEEEAPPEEQAETKEAPAAKEAPAEPAPDKPDPKPTAKVAEETQPEKADSAGVQPDTATGIFNQGVQSMLRAQYSEAETHFDQAMNMYRKAKDKDGQISILNQLGHLCFMRGDEDLAQDYYRQAEAMRRA